MRKNYFNNGFSVAFGFDRMNGIFVQVFDKDDELILDLDQSIVLTGLQFSSKISREKMIETLTKYSEEALKDFYEFENQPLSETLKGYAYNQDGKYEDYDILKTLGDWFKFFDKVENGFTLTDIFDCLVSERKPK